MIKKLLIRVLKELVERLDAGTCEMSEEEMLQALEVLNKANSNRQLSKE